jgi:small subunit ribosomal protein S17
MTSANTIHALHTSKMASIISKAAKPILPPLFHSQKVGVVVSAGKMAGAVKVRVAEVEWNKKFRKVTSPRTFYL